jgi:hypothetical protein
MQVAVQDEMTPLPEYGFHVLAVKVPQPIKRMMHHGET